MLFDDDFDDFSIGDDEDNSDVDDDDVDLVLVPLGDEGFADSEDSSSDTEVEPHKVKQLSKRRSSSVSHDLKNANNHIVNQIDEGDTFLFKNDNISRKASLENGFPSKNLNLESDYHNANLIGDQRKRSVISEARRSSLVGRRQSTVVIPERNRRISNVRRPSVVINQPRLRWVQAINKAMHLKDPWGDFSIANLPTETVRRHRYSPLKKKWTQDEVYVKVEKKAFNRGAMRECFRLKKLSNFHHKDRWSRAHNYVAKCYIEEVDREVYFEDVKLQMDAKLWGYEYNNHNPPKKVDIMQMCIIEFINREGSSLYHLEHFIEGNYIKYNSNSGFVSDAARATPHAFSHFTFERSGHELIVVDVQGVGDLWTDPQIHTANGTEYGDGNLGTRGMALFFHSHVCNTICEKLKLTQFDLAPTEMQGQEKFIELMKMSSQTCQRSDLNTCISTLPFGWNPLQNIRPAKSLPVSPQKHRLTSVTMEEDEEDEEEEEPMEPETPTSPMSFTSDYSDLSSGGSMRVRKRVISESSEASLPDFHPMYRSRFRTFSGESTDSGSGTWTQEEEKRLLMNAMIKHRPSSVAAEVDMTQLRDIASKSYGSILGMVHLDMAKYHELGRFKVDDNDECDMVAGMFHLQQAVNCGVLEAIKIMSRLYLNMQTDALSSIVIQPNSENADLGIEYMLLAADAGDRSAMIYMAKTYQSGEGLGSKRTKDWKEAAYWYDRALHTTACPDASGDFDSTMDDPPYMLMAAQAELWMQGGHNLQVDPNFAGELYTEAADAAMAAMKGRLANKYYALAEEAWAAVEDPEE